MKRCRVFGSARSLALGLMALSVAAAQPAGASTVAAPPIYIPSTQMMRCLVTNVGSSPITVDVELLGGPAVPLGSTTMVLSPGATDQFVRTGGGLQFCRVSGTSSRRVKVTACMAANTGSPCTAITTAP